MSNELQYYGDTSLESGLTVTAKVYDSAGAQVGGTVSCSEVGSLAIYLGNMPSASAGVYGVRFFNGTNLLGQGKIEWDGDTEITTPTRTSLENIGVNIQQVNGYDVDGEGTESSPWGPI